MNRLATLFGILLFFSLHALTAQESYGADYRYDVAWLEYEAAERLSKGDLSGTPNYADALRRYARALEIQPLFPEAYVGMARVYVAIQDTVLAERYYRRAIDLSDQLLVRDEKYAIRLELAELFDGRRYEPEYDRKYRDELLQIIEDDPTYSNNDPPGQRANMLRTLFSSGLDRVLVLYRLDFPASLEAHRLYARYLLDQPALSAADRTEAVEHLLFAIVEVVGRGVDAIIDREFDYQFSNLVEFVERAARYDPIISYLFEERLVDLLSEFALALDGIDLRNIPERVVETEAQIVKIREIIEEL